MATAPPPLPKRAGINAYPIVRASEDYAAQDATECSFKKGELVTIIDPSDPNTWKIQVNGVQGTAPAAVLSQEQLTIFPVHEAAKRGNLAFLNELIAAKVSVNTLDHAGNSPLYWACRGGHLACVQALMAAKAVAGGQNKLGDTLLHGAAWGGHAEVVQRLLALPGATNMMQIRNGQGQVAYEMAKTPEVAALLDPLRFQTVAQEDEGEFSDDG